MRAKIGHVLPFAEVTVRCENAEDARERPVVRSIDQAAFGGPDEAELIDAVRADGAEILSLVAELGPRIVGRILFSRMWIDTGSGPVPAVALAPMAVLPDCQRRGIGGRLIRTGLDALRARGERIVIVVGHPAYYPRFGFSSERARPLDSPFPPEAFMAQDLSPGALDGIRGKVGYSAAFGL